MVAVVSGPFISSKAGDKSKSEVSELDPGNSGSLVGDALHGDMRN